MDAKEQSPNVEVVASEIPQPLWRRLKQWLRCGAIDKDQFNKLLEQDEKDRVEYAQKAHRDMELARANERARLRRARVANVAIDLLIHTPLDSGHVPRIGDRAAIAVRKATELVDAVDLALAAQFDQDPPQ